MDPRPQPPHTLLQLSQEVCGAIPHSDDPTLPHRLVVARLLYATQAALPCLAGPAWSAQQALAKSALGADAAQALLTLDEALEQWTQARGGGESDTCAALLHPLLLGLDQSARRSAGVFYTPAPTARWLVEKTLDGLGPPAGRGWHIADPCCGCGAFLLASVDALEAMGELDRLGGLHGRDVDAIAVEIARVRLSRRMGPRAEAAEISSWIRVEDGLSCPLPTLDAVVSNPPFGNAIEAETGRDEAARLMHKALTPEVARGAYDASVPFAARAAQRLRDGGRYGLVLPRSLLSVNSAAALRTFLGEQAPPSLVWAPSQSKLFDGADVYVFMVVGERGAREPSELAVSLAPSTSTGGPEGGMSTSPGPMPEPWMPILLPEWSLLKSVESAPIALAPLADLFEVHGGAATGAAYDLKRAIERGDCLDGPHLVTTGLIDRYTCLWGQRTCRFLGLKLSHPRWPTEGAPRSVERAMERQRVPKVLVGGLTKILEAVSDPRGELAGVVSTWVVRPAAGNTQALWLLEALLNSPLLSLSYMTRFRGKEMSGGNTTIGKRELGALPIPADLDTLVPESLTKNPATAPPRPEGCFELDATDPHHRRLLARWAVEAVQRREGAAVDPARDALAAACIARLFGASREDHEASLRWFSNRCGVTLFRETP